MTQKTDRRSLAERIADRVTELAHAVEPQGDGIFMVLIRLDEIVRIVKGFRRQAAVPRKKRKRARKTAPGRRS
jgi:hypothetical protein